MSRKICRGRGRPKKRLRDCPAKIIMYVMGGIPKKRATSSRGGQAMVEYVIVLVMLTALVSVMAVLLYTARSQSRRAAELVSSEYP